MFDTVIVPLDGSFLAERALGPARAIARATRARVLIVSAAPGPETADHRAVELKERLAELDVPVDDVRIETFVPAHRLILEAAGQEGDSLVCMASHGRGGLASTVLGSVAKQVVSEADRPIMVVGPKCEPDADPTHGIGLLTTDGSDFADAVVPLAIAWTVAFELTPWLAAVVVPQTAGSLPVGCEDVSESSAVHSVVDRMVRQGLQPQWDVLHGARPAPEIVGRARALPASVIFMSTHGRTGLTGLALGSVATDVVRDAPCPVLLQRPGC